MAPPNKREGPVRCVADVAAVLGEGPVWVEREGALYWVDITGRKIFRLEESGERTEWDTPVRVGSLIPRRGGGFIGGTDRGIALIDVERGKFDVVCEPESGRPSNRFNDGKTDRQGRLWAGTMDDEERQSSGALYRVGADLHCDRVDDGYKVTNGPAFSPDGTVMYVTDSALQTIYAFDLDVSGAASGKRTFAQFGEGDGYPDGMTVDSDGNLWVAFWDGWCLRRIAPSGETVERIAMPVQRPTSCAFGGRELDRLYVTSATKGLTGEALRMQPCAGGLLLMDTDVRGIAETPFAG